jgi:hypothetical protein
MKKNKSISIINHEAFDLSDLDIQREVTGYFDQIKLEAEVKFEHESLLTQMRHNSYKQKQRLNEIFPNVFYLRIINPGIFDKSKWLYQLEIKSKLTNN